MSILLMLKKSPNQVGYGKLQTFKVEPKSSETYATAVERVRHEAMQAARTWRMNFSSWVIRVVNTDDFDDGWLSRNPNPKYAAGAYYDDVMALNPMRLK